MSTEKDKKEKVAEPAEPVAVDELAARLTEAGVSEDVIGKIKEKLGANTVADLSLLTEADLVGVGMKAIPARTLLKGLAPAEPAVAAGGLMNLAYDDVLPPVGSPESWLTALRAGGVLKVEQSTVEAAVRAALAHRAGLYTVPGTLVSLMEAFADKNEDQVDTEFYRLRKQLTRRTYGDLFEAIDGLDGSFVTDARRKELLQRIDEGLWPALNAFHAQLKGWQESYLGPGMQMMVMNNLLLSSLGGGSIAGVGGMMPPDTSTLRAQAEEVNDAVNRVFAGTGVQITSALAYEAAEICKTLENPRLPSLIGEPNRDQMLKRLGVAVTAAYTRQESNLVRYVLSIFQIETIPNGADEIRFFVALFMLGSQINWDKLGGAYSEPKVTGIGGGRL